MSLFTTHMLGAVKLKNRIVMASMTRGRTVNAGHVPNDLQAEYYRQRASAGLIFTEATWVNRDAIGFINVPGLFTEAQVDGWRKVTDAVHAVGGVIFAQLAHSGAISHPDFFDGALPLAPSAVNPGLRAFTSTGFKDTVTPRAMSTGEIARTISDIRGAGANALRAGFDGIELHCATTYLFPEFLNSELNVRNDRYGGSAQNRCRIVLETLDALMQVWGPGRVGVKISPAMSQGGFRPTDATVETYDYLVDALDQRPLSHLQVLRATGDLRLSPIAPLQDTIGHYRKRFNGTLIANFGFDKSSAESLIAGGGADLVSFGKPFISNPDLVERFERGRPLSEPVVETFYQGGAQGYVDYARAS